MIANDSTTIRIPIGQRLTVTPSGGGIATVTMVGESLDPQTPVVVSGSASIFGPYNAVQVAAVVCSADTITTVVALPDPSLAATDVEVAAAIAASEASTAAILAANLISGAGVPTNTVTGAGVSEIGSLYLDRTNGKAYINGGTKAVPVWKLITSAA